MGEVVALPRPPRPAPGGPATPPAAPAVARPAAGFLAIIGFRRGMRLALEGETPEPNAAQSVLDGHALGARLLRQPMIEWQAPTVSRARRRRRPF